MYIMLQMISAAFDLAIRQGKPKITIDMCDKIAVNHGLV